MRPVRPMNYLPIGCLYVLSFVYRDSLYPCVIALGCHFACYKGPSERNTFNTFGACHLYERQRCAIQPVAYAIDFPGYETEQRSYVSKMNRAETKQKAHGQQRRNKRRCGRMPRCKQTHEIELYAEQTYTAASSYIRSVYWQHPHLLRGSPGGYCSLTRRRHDTPSAWLSIIGQGIAHTPTKARGVFPTMRRWTTSSAIGIRSEPTLTSSQFSRTKPCTVRFCTISVDVIPEPTTIALFCSSSGTSTTY